MARGPHRSATTPSVRPTHQNGKLQSDASTLNFVAAGPRPSACSTNAMNVAAVRLSQCHSRRRAAGSVRHRVNGFGCGIQTVARRSPA
jgi:hypothetical protein